MPLASTVALSPHFTAFELGADKPEANDGIISNLRRTAEGLERIRSVLQSRLQVNTTAHRNRGFRTKAENVSAGGSSTSDHLTGLAADFVALDLRDMAAAYQALRDADIGPFDQLIFYPTTGHIHVGYGGSRREYRVYLFEGVGGTPVIGSDFAQTFGGSVVYAATKNPVGSIAVFVAAILFLVAITKK